MLALGLLLAATTTPAQRLPGTDAAVREVPVAADAFVRGAPLPDWVQRVPVPPTSRQDAAVIRLSDSQIRVDASESTFTDIALQVNEAGALDQIGQLRLAFVPAFQRLQLHSVRILRGDEVLDRTEAANVRFLQPAREFDTGMLTGLVLVAVLVPDVRVGDTLSLAYSTEGANPVYGPLYFEIVGWEMQQVAELRRVVLSHRAQREIRWQMVGDAGRPTVTPEERTQDGWRTLRFEERAVAPSPDEPFMPAAHVARRMLQFTEYHDWNQLARWAEALFAPVPELPDELRAQVQRLAALPDATARTQAALRWVQSEIRNFSLSLGENSHRPHPPATVLQRRWGDCKDKTYLLLTLLRALDVPATPMLVSTSAPALPGRLLPSPAGFDHVVLRVELPGGAVLLDATRPAQPVPLARLAGLPRLTVGLLATAQAQAPTGVPAPTDPDSDLVSQDERFEIPALAPAGRLLSRLTLRGARAEGLRQLWPLLDDADRRQAVLVTYERRYPGITLADDLQLVDEPEHNRISLTSRFNVPALVRHVGGHWVMEFFPAVLIGKFNLPPGLQRSQPLVVMDHPIKLHGSLQVQWPAEVSESDDPVTRVLAGRVFRAETYQAFRGNRFDFSLDLHSLTATLPAADVPRLLEDLDRLSRQIGGRVVVDARRLRPEAGAGSPGAVATSQARFAQQLTQVNQVLAGASPSPADRAEALSLRAQALDNLGRAAEGLADSAEAVRLAPEVAAHWRLHGALLRNSGDFTAADHAFTRALALGHPAESVLYARGISRYYQGRRAEAAADFAGAVAASGDTGSNRLYAMLWQIWALQQARQPLPSALLAEARSAPTGPWPRPAMAMLVGAITPEALLAQVDAMSGDEAELNRVEALFYVAQHHLVQGRTAAARTALEACRAMGATFYDEHVAAGFELARLEGKP